MEATPDLVTATRLAYERNAESWTKAAADRTGYAASYDTFAALVRAGGLVLDLGCGAGHDAPGLAAGGLQLVGLDITPALLVTAKRQPALTGSLALGDLRTLPFRERAFDGVWACGVLHHVPKAELPAALREAHRVLAPGGVLYASVERGAGEGMAPPTSEVADHRFFARYQPDELQAYLATAGFDVTHMAVGDPGPRTGGFIGATARKPGRP